MRRHSPLPLPANADQTVKLWPSLRALWPYVWQWRTRVVLALSCLLVAKLANVAVPMVFKHLVDDLSVSGQQALLVVPAALLLAYGALRFASSAFTELREILFARVTQETLRRVTLEVFNHLHSLSLRFHLERQTGGLTRDIERGTRAITSLISYAIYSILPMLVEMFLVIAILVKDYDWRFALTTLVTLTLYITFTIVVTNWRTQLRREANELDSAANTRAIDSLLNYETVKYFNNEQFESTRYDTQLQRWSRAQLRNQYSLTSLNLGQALIIACGVSVMMWQAAAGVVAGRMSLGDVVLVNAFLIQLYLPLNFLGVIYRELRQSMIDLEKLFKLLHTEREVVDAPDAQALPSGPLQLRFEHVHFAYDPRRPVLEAVSLDLPAGKTLAVVGHSGAGKSTLSRLLFRFYDVSGGRITLNGIDIRQIRQDELRRAIGIVPQDTVLFNDTLAYNIRYGRPDASDDEVFAAARAAHLEAFVRTLPEAYDTKVGERGLKLSGGEKQRVAIARALLKNPPILILDEASSALDTQTEKTIQSELEAAARGRTALIIAHRLSTIMHADEIVVMEQGKIVERGQHQTLLAQNGHYAHMWALQQQAQTESGILRKI